MAKNSCVKRLQKEYRALCKEPVSHVVSRPSLSDILEWHYVLEGSEGTPFAGCLLTRCIYNSPTTGNVNTTVAEKQRLAKTSLAFNAKNVTFRKMFPEYVEKYNQHQLNQEQADPESSQENSN